MDWAEDLSLFEILVILVLVGGAGYFIYKKIEDYSNDPSNIDPATGQSNGPLNGINQALFPESFPGGGATGAETYTGAATEEILAPVGSFDALIGKNPGQSWSDYFGFGSTNPATSAAVPGALGQNPNLESNAF